VLRRRSNPEQVIVACTAVITEGSVSRKDLGSVFKIRGNAYDESGHYDRWIEDYGPCLAVRSFAPLRMTRKCLVDSRRSEIEIIGPRASCALMIQRIHMRDERAVQ
jgi:hypothetical protein